MSTVAVQLVNTTDEDASVGIDSTHITAKAHAITDAQLDTRSSDAYGFLAQGVSLIPGGVPLDQVRVEQPTEEHDVLAVDEDDTAAEPKPKTRRRKQQAAAAESA
jgi:hypothetical protein